MPVAGDTFRPQYAIRVERQMDGSFVAALWEFRTEGAATVLVHTETVEERRLPEFAWQLMKRLLP